MEFGNNLLAGQWSTVNECCIICGRQPQGLIIKTFLGPPFFKLNKNYVTFQNNLNKNYDFTCHFSFSVEHTPFKYL